MNQTSLVGRPLYHMAQSVARYMEKRSSWTGPLTSSSPELARLWGSTPTSTGIGVDEVSALTYSTVWACVNNISTDVASLPLILYKTLPNGGKQRLTDHKLYRLLHDEPNPEMSSMTFRGMVQAHALTWGNGYAEIVRDGGGRPVAIWPITPNRVSVGRDARGPYYDIAQPEGGPPARLRPENVLHIQGLGFDGSVGYSLIAKARESIALGLATERFGGTFFGNGATFGGVFEHPTRMSEQALKNFRESINTQHQGVDRAHKFVVVEEGMKYQKLGVDPNHAQFLETRDKQIEEICRYYRMPPHKVQHLIRTSYNSIEHQGIEYYSDTLRPWCVRWEQEIKRKLIAPSERMIQHAEHKIEGVLRGDLSSRYAAYAVGRQWGWLSANRICELENMDPLPVGGDVFLVPMNMSPADRLDEIVDKQVAPEPKPEPVAAKEPEPKDDSADRAIAAMTAQIAALTARAEQFTELAQDADGSVAAGALDEARQAREQAAEALRQVQALTILKEDAVAELAREKAEHDQVTDEWSAEAIRLKAALDAAVEESNQRAAEAARLQAELDAIEAQAARDREIMAQTAVAADLTLSALRAEIAAADASHVETKTALDSERTAREAALQQLADLQATITATQAEVARLAAERATLASEATTSAEAAAEAHRATGIATAMLAQATADAEAARQLLEEETARVIEARAEKAELAALMDTQRQAHAARQQALLPARRAQAVDTFSRLVRVEADRARRNQGSPAKLKAWAEAYFLQREEQWLDAVRADMRAHLVFIGSDEDVDSYTSKLVAPQLLAAVQQIRTIADGDAEDFSVSLERLLTKWEQERPVALADRVFQEEMTYVRSL